MAYDNNKSRKKAGFHPLFKRYNFGKTTGDSISQAFYLGLIKTKTIDELMLKQQ